VYFFFATRETIDRFGSVIIVKQIMQNLFLYSRHDVFNVSNKKLK